MELHTLRYFVEIADQKSISKAAQTLYVSQSALSRAMQGLEEELGLPMLLRNNRGVSLTPVGEKLYYYARSVVGQMDAIDRLRADLGQDVPSKLAVAVAKLILKDDLLLQYRRKLNARQAALVISETTLENAIAEVASLAAEIGLLAVNSLQLPALRKVLEIRELEMQVLGEGPACVHLSKDTPLAALHPLPPAALLDYAYMHLPFDYFANINYLHQIQGIQLGDFKRTITINNYHAMINMLKHTDSFIFGNIWQQEELEKCNICTRPMGGELRMTLLWIKRKKETLSAEALCFLDLLRANYGFGR